MHNLLQCLGGKGRKCSGKIFCLCNKNIFFSVYCLVVLIIYNMIIKRPHILQMYQGNNVMIMGLYHPGMMIVRLVANMMMEMAIVM